MGHGKERKVRGQKEQTAHFFNWDREAESRKKSKKKLRAALPPFPNTHKQTAPT